MYLIILCEFRIKFMLSLRYEQKREIKKKNPLSLKVIFVTFKQSPCCNIWRKTYCIIIRITIHTVNMSVVYVTSQRRLMGKLFRGYCSMPPSHIIQHNLYWHTSASYNVESPSRHRFPMPRFTSYDTTATFICLFQSYMFYFNQPCTGSHYQSLQLSMVFSSIASESISPLPPSSSYFLINESRLGKNKIVEFGNLAQNWVF